MVTVVNLNVNILIKDFHAKNSLRQRVSQTAFVKDPLWAIMNTVEKT